MAVPGEILRATLEYSPGNSSTPLNVFQWLKASNNTDETDLTVLGDWFREQFAADWGPLAAESIELLQVTVEVLSALGAVIRLLGSESIGVAGTVASPVTPAGVAGLAVAHTAEPGVQGKKYIYGLTEGTVEAGLLTTAATDAMVDILTLWLTPIDLVTPFPLTMIPGVFSSKLGEFVPFSGSGVVTNNPSYQRRRKLGVGM